MRKKSSIDRTRQKIDRRARNRQVVGFFRKIKTPILILLLLTSLSYGLYYAVYKWDYFLVDNIEITGTSKFVNTIDLQNFVQANQIHKNILLLNTMELSKEIKNRFLGASSVEIGKKYPNTLIVKITERKPLALLKNDISTEYYLIDQEGYLLGTVEDDPDNLPKINFVGDLRVGEFVSKDLVPIYYDIIEALDESKVKVSSMSFYEKHIVFYTNEGVRVLVGNEKEKSTVLSALTKLLKALQIENKKPNSIDLRYDKVVVSY